MKKEPSLTNLMDDPEVAERASQRVEELKSRKELAELKRNIRRCMAEPDKGASSITYSGRISSCEEALEDRQNRDSGMEFLTEEERSAPLKSKKATYQSLMRKAIQQEAAKTDSSCATLREKCSGFVRQNQQYGSCERTCANKNQGNRGYLDLGYQVCMEACFDKCIYPLMKCD